MHDIHDVSDFRLHDDYSISLPSVGQRLMFSVLSCAHCSSIGGFLQLLTVSELRTIFFVSSQCVYIFDYLFLRGDILDK